MTPWRPQWSYVQARLQARHGDRLDASAWHVLEGVRSADHFLERARASSLARFLARLETRMSSHMVERILRAEWRDYVGEVASWAPTPWWPAVRWTGHIAVLPLLGGAASTQKPNWLAEEFEIEQVADVIGDTGPIARKWLLQWRRQWPKMENREREALEELIDLVGGHFAVLKTADMQDSSRRYRESLAGGLIRLFRRYPATPAALFCHLALEMLELERLRGNVVRRLVFQAGEERRAA